MTKKTENRSIGNTSIDDAPAGPRFDEFDPLGPAQLADPHPWLVRARRDVPVFYMPTEQMWCVTRYADVLAITRDTRNFSNTGADAVVAPRPTSVGDILPRGHPISNSLHDLDPPEHTRVRRLAQKAFTKRHAEQREAEIRSIADALIDEFIESDEVDLVSAYASQIPSRVIAPILGAPISMAQQLKGWADDFFLMAGNRHLHEDQNEALWRRTAEFEEFLHALVRERRAAPRNDLTSDLIRADAEDGSPALSDYEIVTVIAGLIGAGADTTNGLVTNAMDVLLSEPDHWEAVKADPSRIPAMIEEILRLRCPVRGQRRVTLRPVEIAGVPIPAGATVFIHAASANRDESVFDDPDTFDPDRPNITAHLGLGAGTHFCLGAPLARVEAKVAVERLAARLPAMRRVENQALEWSASTYVPGLLGLRVSLR